MCLVYDVLPGVLGFHQKKVVENSQNFPWEDRFLKVGDIGILGND